jgi:hypothetical protein
MVKHISLRLPDEVHAALAQAAREDRRSLHSELLWLAGQALAARAASQAEAERRPG